MLAVMALSMVVVTVLLVVGSVSTARLSMAGRSRGEAQATYAAESAIARATAVFLEDRPKHTSPAPADIVVEDKEAGSTALLTFRQDADVPFSTNRWDTDASAVGWDGFTVPGRSLHLVATGKCRGVERVVQTVLHIPPFPYVIASSGVVNSDGGLLVTGVADAKDVTLQNGVVTIPKEKETSGHVATNGTGDPALFLGPDTEVTGDVRSAGKISLDPSAVVRGEVRPDVDPIGIPKLDISSYDPAGRPGVQHLDNEEYPNSVYTERLKLEGFVRREGSLEVLSKGVEMKGAVLYVNGDLDIRGPIEGKGAIIVTGDCTLHGGAKLSTDNEAALVVGGNTEIHGDGKQSTFVGLVYTEGDFTAEDITLVGAFVANNVTGGGSAMRMNRVNLVSVPTKTEFSWNTPFGFTSPSSHGVTGYWIDSSATLKAFSIDDPPIPGKPPYDPNAITVETAEIKYIYQGQTFKTKAEFLSRTKRERLPSQIAAECASATNWDQIVSCEERRVVDNLRRQLVQANEKWQEIKMDVGSFKIDLNRFVSLEDRVRTTQWTSQAARRQ